MQLQTNSCNCGPDASSSVHMCMHVTAALMMRQTPVALPHEQRIFARYQHTTQPHTTVYRQLQRQAAQAPAPDYDGWRSQDWPRHNHSAVRRQPHLPGG
jgi:hypothetical protein